MALIDKSHEPQPGPKKTRSVKLQRSKSGGRFVTVKTLSGDSPTLSDDLRYVFTSNVRSVRRKK
jgi:hypothetical protein